MDQVWIPILTVIGSTLIIVLSFFGIMMTLILSNRKETNKFINENSKQSQILLAAIKEEIEDFHNRLCQIEGEKNSKGNKV